jgi:hypothetical protein
MNDKHFVSIIEDVYSCKALHSFVNQGSGGVPIFKVTKIIGGNKYVNMPFNFYPELVGDASDKDAIALMADMAKKDGSGAYVEYKTLNKPEKKFCADNNVTVYNPYIISNLILADDYEKVRKNYKKQHRTNLNAAVKKTSVSIQINWAQGSDLSEWFSLLQHVYKSKHNMITQPFGLYEKLSSYHLGKLLVAKAENRLVGGIYLITGENHWEYSWGAVSSDTMYKNVFYCLVDTAIRYAVESKVNSFGFGSTPITDEKLRFFKARWGCIEQNVFYCYWGKKIVPLDLNRSYRKLRKLFPLLPNWLLGISSNILVKLMA